MKAFYFLIPFCLVGIFYYYPQYIKYVVASGTIFILIGLAIYLINALLEQIEMSKVKVHKEKIVYLNDHGLPPISLHDIMSGRYNKDILNLSANNLPGIYNRSTFTTSYAPVQEVVQEEAKPKVLEVMENSDAAILFGQRGSGKTNLLQHFVAQAAKKGKVIVCDPHSFPGKWGMVKVIGEQRNFAAIDLAVQDTIAEMHKRATQLGQGLVTEEELQADPYYLIIDEILTVVQNVSESFKSNIRQLIAESRKFGIVLIIASQGYGVQAIGLERFQDLKRSLLLVQLRLTSTDERKAFISLGKEEPREAELPGKFKTSVRARLNPVTIPYTMPAPEEIERTEQNTNITPFPVINSSVPSIPSYKNITEAIKGEMRKDKGGYTATKYEEYKTIVLERIRNNEIQIEKLKSRG